MEVGDFCVLKDHCVAAASSHQAFIHMGIYSNSNDVTLVEFAKQTTYNSEIHLTFGLGMLDMTALCHLCFYVLCWKWGD